MGASTKISLLYYLFIIRSAGSLRALESMRRNGGSSAGRNRCRRGSRVPLADRLVLGSPVHRISDDHEFGDRSRIEATQSRGAAGGGGDDARGHSTDRLRVRVAAGTSRAVRHGEVRLAIKVNVVYDNRSGGEDGLSGLGLSDQPPIGVTFDNSPADGSRGVLLAFLTEDAVPKDPAIRRNAVLSGLARVVRQAGEQTGGLSRDRLVERWLDDGLCLSRAPKRPDAVRPRPSHARRPDPLGRNRDVGSLVRLYGRRGAIGRAGCR